MLLCSMQGIGSNTLDKIVVKLNIFYRLLVCVCGKGKGVWGRGWGCMRVYVHVVWFQFTINNSLLLISKTVWTNSADEKLKKFFLKFPENSFDISCKLSPEETVCMKCQSLFSGKK